MPRSTHVERHYTQRIGWLRAAVLGATDGIVSTAALVVGVAAAESGRGPILVAGVAGLVAGAMSMAAGEYVSVSSQADTERADLARERGELREAPEAELRELAGIYEARGLDPDLARRVAEQLTARDVLAALAVAALAPARLVIPLVSTSSLACLATLGALAASAGGAGKARGAARVTFWSALALALTALVGRVFGTAV